MMMTKGLIGKKLGMTQVFSDEGVSVPVTVIEVEPSVVIQADQQSLDSALFESRQIGRINRVFGVAIEPRAPILRVAHIKAHTD
jgi:ribosomal protein L3